MRALSARSRRALSRAESDLAVAAEADTRAAPVAPAGALFEEPFARRGRVVEHRPCRAAHRDASAHQTTVMAPGAREIGAAFGRTGFARDCVSRIVIWRGLRVFARARAGGAAFWRRRVYRDPA